MQCFDISDVLIVQKRKKCFADLTLCKAVNLLAPLMVFSPIVQSRMKILHPHQPSKHCDIGRLLGNFGSMLVLSYCG